MENRILNRRCFIRKNRMLYCSKCGKQQLQDNYNMERHAKMCNFGKNDFIEVFEENKDYAYAFKISPDNKKLAFFVFTPVLKEWGPKTNIYTGGEWKEVFKAVFYKNSRTVSEKGLYNVDFWMKLMLDEHKMHCLSKDTDYEIVQNFFSDIIGFNSYGSFLDIYRNKGYGDYYPFNRETALSILNDKHFVGKRSGVYGKLIENNDDLIFHIEVTNGINCIFSALVSQRYAFTNTEDANNVLHKLLFHSGNLSIPPAKGKNDRKKKEDLMLRTYANLINEEDLKRFISKYPSFMIKEYLDAGGKNILIPLFASNYDKCMELLYKARMPMLAENLEVVKRNNNLTLYLNNLKEIFGLPINTLKRITSLSTISEPSAFELFKDIYQYDVRYLSGESYSVSAINFLQNQNITNKKDFKPSYLTCSEINRWSDEEKYKTFKYLNKIDGKNTYISIWNLYKDYIDTCARLNDFVYGKWPKDLSLAHDDVMAMYSLKSNKEKEEIFQKVVASDEYLALTTTDDESKENFKEYPYVIIAPKSSYDLVSESANMNNCVKTYIDRVREGRTKIYFLRNKGAIRKALCTIEVSKSNDIIQLKAHSNQQAPTDIKEFVIKWANYNHLGTNCYDLR